MQEDFLWKLCSCRCYLLAFFHGGGGGGGAGGPPEAVSPPENFCPSLKFGPKTIA